MNCNTTQQYRIPIVAQGNAFVLVVPVREAGGGDADLSQADISSVSVFRVSDGVEITDLQYTVDGNTVRIEIPSYFEQSTYRVRIAGTYKGVDVAANIYEAFAITQWGDPDFEAFVPTEDQTTKTIVWIASAATEAAYLGLAEDIINEPAEGGLTPALQQAAASRKAVGEALGANWNNDI